jgi:hypothetical protein
MGHSFAAANVAAVCSESILKTDESDVLFEWYFRTDSPRGPNLSEA